jgi:dihydroxyacetone kinase-like predicted kinase
MTIVEVLKLLGGSTGVSAIMFFTLWLTGQIHTKAAMEEKKEEISELKEALRLERARGDAGVLTGQIVRDVMHSLHRELL